jgi:hypothetical protein
MKLCFGEVGSTAAKFKPFAQVFSASASAASAQIGIVRDLIFGCLCSESAVWVWHLIGNLNGRSGEIRCTANRLPLHLRVNAASAKAKNPRSVLSASYQFMHDAAKVGKHWNQSLVQHAAKATEEPIADVLKFCCVRSQHDKCCKCATHSAAARRRNRSFMQVAANLGTSTIVSWAK